MNMYYNNDKKIECLVSILAHWKVKDTGIKLIYYNAVVICNIYVCTVNIFNAGDKQHAQYIFKIKRKPQQMAYCYYIWYGHIL